MGLFSKFIPISKAKKPEANGLSDGANPEFEATLDDLENVKAGITPRQQQLIEEIQRLSKENETSHDPYYIADNKRQIEEKRQELDELTKLR